MSGKSIFAERRPGRLSLNDVWVVSGRSNATNTQLVGALHECGVGAKLVAPAKLTDLVRRGDTVLGRLDVRPTLDGVEDGLSDLSRVGGCGTRIRNPAPSLLACHDKLQTAIRLARWRVPHPTTAYVDETGPYNRIVFPVVVKPRFGSWGRDVFLCRSERELRRCLRRIRRRGWFRRQGALVEELVPPRGYDLRVIVACGEVVGAVRRVAARGEWRTNVALGGTRQPVAPTPEARALALTAAAAVGGDFVGVDLLPCPGGGYVVLEVNGAVDFTSEYSLGSEDVFEAVARRIAPEPVEVSVAERLVGRASRLTPMAATFRRLASGATGANAQW